MKLIKEEDKNHKTLSKENKRLEIFMIIFMVIAICFGTFYFNVVCFGTECENKTPKPLIMVGSSKTENEIKKDEIASDIDITGVYISEKDEKGNEYWLTLRDDKTYEYSYNGNTLTGNYKVAGDVVCLNCDTEIVDGDEESRIWKKEFDIISRSKLYDKGYSISLTRANIPTRPGEE